MKTARLTVKYSLIRGPFVSSTFDAGPGPLDITYCKDAERLRVTGTKCELLLDDVVSFDIENVLIADPAQEPEKP